MASSSVVFRSWFRPSPGNFAVAVDEPLSLDRIGLAGQAGTQSPSEASNTMRLAVYWPSQATKPDPASDDRPDTQVPSAVSESAGRSDSPGSKAPTAPSVTVTPLSPIRLAEGLFTMRHFGTGRGLVNTTGKRAPWNSAVSQPVRRPSGKTLLALVDALRGVRDRGVAPRVGFEPTTNRLTADRSTTELPRNRPERAPL